MTFVKEVVEPRFGPHLQLTVIELRPDLQLACYFGGTRLRTQSGYVLQRTCQLANEMS